MNFPLVYSLIFLLFLFVVVVSSNTGDSFRFSVPIGVREGVSGVYRDTPVGLETSGSLEVS